MTQGHATLELSADIDGDGTPEDATFTLLGDIEVNQQIRTGFLIGGRQSQANSILANLVADGESNRQNFFLDLGAGARTWDVDWTGWEGATDANGDPVQWGNTGDPSSLTVGDATGADPVAQMEVFFEWLSVGTIDSSNPATLHYGEHTQSGLYQPVDVVIESPAITKSAEDGSWVTGSMTLIAAADVKAVYDAKERLPL